MTAEGPDAANWFEIAKQWAELPPTHMRIAAKAAETHMARQHEYRMELARLDRERETEEKTHRLYVLGLIAGFLLAAGMLIGAVAVGINDQPWLAAMLAGPSVLSLAALFVLRRTDTGQTRATAQAHTAAMAIAPQPPVVP